MSIPVEIAMFHDNADGECHRCRHMYEINAHAAFHDDDWTCPACAGLISPGMEEVIRGLDLIYDGVTLDMFTRAVLPADLDTVTSSLRRLADIIDDINAGRTKLQLSTRVMDSFVPGEEGQPAGFTIDRRIVVPTVKEIAS